MGKANKGKQEAPKEIKPIDAAILAMCLNLSTQTARARVTHERFGQVSVTEGVLVGFNNGDPQNPMIGPSIAVQTDEVRRSSGSLREVVFPPEVLAEANKARVADPSMHGQTQYQMVLDKYAKARARDNAGTLSVNWMPAETKKVGRHTETIAPARWVECEISEKVVVVHIPVRDITLIEPVVKPVEREVEL